MINSFTGSDLNIEQNTDSLIVNVSADVTEATNGNVILTAVFSSDIVRKEYSLDNEFWKEYPSEGVTVTENKVIYFRGFDAVGSVTATAEFKVENIDKTAPEKPGVSADVTLPTNNIVTVTPEFSPDSVKYEYSQNGSDWSTYDGSGVIFEENGYAEFRSYDAVGNVSASTRYDVSNIDHKKPTTPQLSADITALTNQAVTVDAVFSSDSVKYEYNLNGAGWQSYDAAGVVFNENGFVDFRSYDAAGNVSESSRYNVNNIDKLPPEAPRISLSRTDYISSEPVTFVAAAAEGSLEYSFDSKVWQSYTGPVKVYDNTMVYVRTTDAAGNSAISSAEITAIDSTADSSHCQYVFIKSSYTAKNTNGKRVNGIDLQYGENAFSSLDEAKQTLKNPDDPLYVFVMVGSKSVISGLLEDFEGKHINGAVPKVTVTEDADHDYTISANAKNRLDIVSGDYSDVDIKWFRNINISGRAQVNSVTGGTYKLSHFADSTVNSKGLLTESENYSSSYQSGGKLVADCFAQVNKLEHIANVVLDNVSITELTGGNRSDKRRSVIKYQNDSLKKSITCSGSWSASGSITLKNIAHSDIISGYKILKITNASVQNIYSSSGKYSYQEQSTYKQDKVTRTVTRSDTFASSGTLTAKFSIFTGIYGVTTVKLTDCTVKTVQNSDAESLNGTFKEKLSVKTAADGTVTAQYEKNDTFKRNGTFTATAENDRMLADTILYFNKVTLNQANAGTITNLLQTQSQEVYRQIWTDATAYGTPDDLAMNIDREKAQLIRAQYKYSASGSVTLKNNASAESIIDYKSVYLTDSEVTGDIVLGDCRTVKYKAAYDSVSGTETSTRTTTYTRSGSVKLTGSTVGGNITGYKNVVLDNSTAGNISQSTIVKEVSKKINGIDDVNNSYATEKLSGSLMLKNRSEAGDISNYSSVVLNDSSAGNLSNVNKVKVGKGHGAISSWQGTSGNDTFTIAQGAVFTVTNALDFGAGNKDSLVVNGTLILYTGDITGLEKISGKGDIAVSNEVAKNLDIDFENLLNLGNTVKNFQGSTTEISDNSVKNAFQWDGEEIFNGWLGNDVDCVDTVDFIKFKTSEACTLKLESSAWEKPSTDLVAVNNVILTIADGSAQIELLANTEYTVKLQRNDSNSMDYSIFLA